MADWVRGRLPDQPDHQISATAAVALNSLFAARMTRHVLDADPQGVDDDTFIAEWVEMVAGRIEALAAI